MGMNSDVIAVGAFKQSLIEYLDYPAHFYSGLNEGSTIITTAVGEQSTTYQSNLLADALGCNADDFSTHVIDKDAVNWLELEQIVGEHEARGLYAFLDAGFTAYFRPNT
jgi:hypothetical protein